MARALLVALAALHASACGGCNEGEASLEPSLDLLVRRPDVLVEQPGRLVPRPKEDWGAYGGSGWRETLTPLALPDGRIYVETNQPRASLRLPALDPAARELALTLWRTRAAPGSSGRATLRLNGLVLAELELGDAPAVQRVATRAELWRRGDNALELSVPEVGAPEARAWDTLAVADVEYGPELLARFDDAPRAVELPAGTGVCYVVETGAGGALVLRGAASGPGELAVACERFDPRQGERTALGEPARFAFDGSLERVLALPDAAGDPLALELAWSSPAGAGLRLTTLGVAEREARPRPPIVLVSIDTFSARHLALYGYGRATSPNLEALARDGVVFERCVANAPWTMPSYLSVMTGLYPESHLAEVVSGRDVALDNFDYWQIADNRWTLAEGLRARGYQTAAAVDTLWLSPLFRVDQGFDLYDLSAAEHAFTDPYYGIRYIVEHLAGWLDRARDPRAPWFVFVHALDAHGPYLPEAPFRDAFAADLPADRRPTPAGSVPMTYGAIPDWMARTMVPDEHEPIPSELPLEEIVERYDEALLKTDASLGKLFDLLRERGLYDDAIVVVTGDHGESFAHDFYSHGCMWEDIVEVPLVIKLPHQAHAGTRVATSVQLVDLYPTLLALAGADAERSWLHGRSLLPLIEGRAGARPTFSQGGHVDQSMLEDGGLKLVELRPGKRADVPELLTHPLVPRAWLAQNFPRLLHEVPTQAVLAELRQDPEFARKFAALRELLAGPFYQLYDLRADPGELHDLAAERPADVERLKGLLAAEQARVAQARADAQAEIRTRSFSPTDLEELRKLGYVDGERPR